MFLTLVFFNFYIGIFRFEFNNPLLTMFVPKYIDYFNIFNYLSLGYTLFLFLIHQSVVVSNLYFICLFI